MKDRIPQHISYSGLDLYELKIQPANRMPINVHRCRSLMEVHEVLVSVSGPIFSKKNEAFMRDTLLKANWNGEEIQMCDSPKFGRITLKYLGNRSDVRSYLPHSPDIEYLPLNPEDLK